MMSRHAGSGEAMGVNAADIDDAMVGSGVGSLQLTHTSRRPAPYTGARLPDRCASGTSGSATPALSPVRPEEGLRDGADCEAAQGASLPASVSRSLLGPIWAHGIASVPGTHRTSSGEGRQMMERGRGSVGRITQLPVEAAQHAAAVADRVTRDGIVRLEEQRELREALGDMQAAAELADSASEVAMHFMRNADRGPRTELLLARLSVRRSRAGMAYQRRTVVREAIEVA